ncbi:DUF1385 domain-containing protein [Paenibacillus sp. FSL R7-0216]|uniref:DUF1385 domain-containing protein n=1 Tax=Paenibacillus sp. FSL R7-0216 TaxID=2921677 RepID=UPI0030DDB1BF
MNLKGGHAFSKGVCFYSDKFVVEAQYSPDGAVTVTDSKPGEVKSHKIYKILRMIPFVRGIALIFNDRSLAIPFVVLFLYLIFFNSFLENINIYFLLGCTAPVLFYGFRAWSSKKTMWSKISTVRKYHAAEHMVAHAWGKGLVLNLESVKKQSRIHPYCGTNLVIFTLTIFLVLIPLPIILILKLLLPFSVGFELFIIASPIIVKVLRPLYWIGDLMQKYITTANPDDKHLLVAIACMERLVVLEGIE